MPPHFSRLHDHTLFRHTTLGRTPLDEGPARRRDYLTTLNTQKTDIHALVGIRTQNHRKRVAADPRLRPRGHWDRPKCIVLKRYVEMLRVLAYTWACVT
jgi:hypothetical protein